MKRLKRAGLLITIAIVLSSCQRACSDISRSVRASKQDYKIELYSGGELVKVWKIESTIVNSSQSSNGYYFYKGDTLIEVDGDVVIYEY